MGGLKQHYVITGIVCDLTPWQLLSPTPLLQVQLRGFFWQFCHVWRCQSLHKCCIQVGTAACQTNVTWTRDIQMLPTPGYNILNLHQHGLTWLKRPRQCNYMSLYFVNISHVGCINPMHFSQNSFTYEILCLLTFRPYSISVPVSSWKCVTMLVRQC